MISFGDRASCSRRSVSLCSAACTAANSSGALSAIALPRAARAATSSAGRSLATPPAPTSTDTAAAGACASAGAQLPPRRRTADQAPRGAPDACASTGWCAARSHSAARCAGSGTLASTASGVMASSAYRQRCATAASDAPPSSAGAPGSTSACPHASQGAAPRVDDAHMGKAGLAAHRQRGNVPQHLQEHANQRAAQVWRRRSAALGCRCGAAPHAGAAVQQAR